ncbi:MAG: hypothetical protein KatS3mg110_0079 [Pirellulaceae bacterium]|nr:MAG: hypothetical protein KatS3mg110_0079 [Pirellulaceae bacterium]
MIIEGILSTRDPGGNVHLAAMGPSFSEGGRQLLLRPFASSQSWQNLQREPYGVFHITDDVQMLVWAALGIWPEAPPVEPACCVPGYWLRSACRWYEFRVTQVDRSQPRIQLTCQVVHAHELRPMCGWNRAQFAVIEATIQATRLAWLDRREVLADLQRWSRLVEKTGGEREHRAMQFVRQYIEQHYQAAREAGAT